MLLDFWASWCGPCLVENPEIKKAYDEFKDKNFTVLSVSLDSNRKMWLDAIKKDNMTWYHVCDLKYWKNEAALLYGIVSVPQNVLIDPAGKVIARNLKGIRLREELRQIIH